VNKLFRQILPFASLLLIVFALWLLAPDRFLTVDNQLNVLRRCSVNAILAVGMTAIIISGGIDLSVGAILAAAGMGGAWTILHCGGSSSSMWLGTIAGICAGTVCGTLNGALITWLKLPPFIVTLGTMSIYRGISYVMNDGQPYNVPDYRFLGGGELLRAPVSVLIAAAIMLLSGLALRYTPLGRYAYAIGSNREAAFHAGINIRRNLLAIYSLSGLLAGVAAMIQTSRTVSAQPTAGIGLELDIIAAVVIGGASLSGGRGSIVGTIIGTLLISYLRNGCTLLGITTNVQLIVIGGIIITAVTVDQVARQKQK